MKKWRSRGPVAQYIHLLAIQHVYNRAKCVYMLYEKRILYDRACRDPANVYAIT